MIVSLLFKTLLKKSFIKLDNNDNNESENNDNNESKKPSKKSEKLLKV